MWQSPPQPERNWIVPAIPWAIALIAYLIAVLSAPPMHGCACFTRWQLFPFILVAFAVAAAAYFQRRGIPPIGDDAQMPSAARLALTLYLLAFGCALVFMLVSLNSLDFPETAVMPLAAPSPSPSPSPSPVTSPTPAPTPTPRVTTGGQPAPQNPTGTNTGQPQSGGNANTATTPTPAPRLFRVFPQATIGSSPTVSLTVYGENFNPSSKVRINSITMLTENISPSLLRADLQPGHLASMGSITVDVESSPNLISNALIVPIVKPTVPLNVFFCWHPLITREAQLLLLVIFAGALGSYLHAIMSIATYIGNRDLKASWFWWYVSRPFLGMAMALVFYAVVRGGFLAGTPADANVVNPFGVLAIGALVGMFSDKAAMKLKDVFDVVFTSKDQRKDPLSAKLAITPASGSLPEASVGVPYEQQMTATGGTPPYKWSITTDLLWLSIDPATGKLTGEPEPEDVGDVNPVIVKVEDSAKGTAEVTLNIKVVMGSSPP